MEQKSTQQTTEWMTMALLSLLLLCTSFPPVFHNWDPYISPKWYATGVAAIIIQLFVLMGLADWNRLSLSKCLDRAALPALAWLLPSAFIQLLRQPYLSLEQTSPWPYDNPSGLAFALCILFVPTMRAVRQNKYAAAMLSVLTFTAVCLTKSRTGIIVMSLFALFFLLRTIRGKVARIIVLLLLLSSLGYYVVTHKRDSTSGRIFILRTTMELIMEKPLSGHGMNGFHREYMDRQGRYFASHPHSPYAMLADEVSHPLNEYLMAWTDGGLLGMVTLILITAAPLIRSLQRRQWMSALQAVPLPVFCCFSYPLNYPLAWVMLSVSLLGMFRSDRKLAKRVFHICTIVIIAYPTCLLMMEKGLMDSGSILYNKAAKEYRRGRFENALQSVSECGKIMSGYNLELLAGDICRHLSRYEDAVSHYKNAANMCPCRFAPLEGLFCVYRSERDSINARTVAEQIVSKPVKVTNSNTTRIKLDAREYLKQYQIKQ